ncbi:MAG TPA: T9SS type A sorting domain-containing protein [Bacteroidia bacterium]|jgi:hypothetical protein
MKKFSRNALPALCFIVLAKTISAQTYYISAAGNDNATGTTVSAAWRTISKLNTMNLLPGTKILLEGGSTFSDGIILDQNDANEPLNPVTISTFGVGRATIESGTNAGLYAYNTEGFKISNIEFKGAGMSLNSTDGVFIYSDLTGNVKLKKIELKNLEIHNYGRTGLSILSTKGNSGFNDVMIDGVHVHDVKENGIVTRGFTMQSHVGFAHQNITIKNTEVNNVPGYSDASTHRGSGIIMGQVNNGLIEYCAVHDNGSANTHCGGPGGIWTWDSNNITIQYSESYRNSGGTGCDGLGFDLDGGVTNSLMQYNYSHDNDGAGYLLGQYDYARPWANNVVRYNISENDGRTNGGGIVLFKGPGTTMTGAKIYNNTIFTSPSPSNSGVGAFKFTEWNTGITGVEVYNNIFQSTGGAYLVYVPTGYNAVFSGNLYWSSGAQFKIYDQSVFYNSLASWRTATSHEVSGTASTGLSSNPNLLNAGNGGTVFPGRVSQMNAYMLNTASPAIDAGLSLANQFNINPGAFDFFNNALSSAVSFDIGAHEFTQTITTGVENVSASEKVISIYPNPVQSGSPIFIKGVELPYSVELVSITGATVWKESGIEDIEFTVPTTGLAAGPYFLMVLDGAGKKKINKMIVQ